MGNCLETKLKNAVTNSNLDVLGYAKVHVCTTGQSSNVSIPFFNTTTGRTKNSVVGAYLLNGKTFVNGKTVIEEGDSMQFAPNDTYELMVPKYTWPIYPSGLPETASYGIAAFNMDDFKWINVITEQVSNDWVTGVFVRGTRDEKSMSGNMGVFLKHLSGDVITSIEMQNSKNMSLDITSDIVKFKKATRLMLSYSKKVIGNLRTFLTNYSTLNAEYLKTRSNTLQINFIGNTDITLADFSGGSMLIIQFNSSNTITLNLQDENGVSIKTFSYNIDTDTLVEQ